MSTDVSQVGVALLPSFFIISPFPGFSCVLIFKKTFYSTLLKYIQYLAAFAGYYSLISLFKFLILKIINLQQDVVVAPVVIKGLKMKELPDKTFEKWR